VDLAHEYNICRVADQRIYVSILVLVDLAHEWDPEILLQGSRKVSILVLVDLAHEWKANDQLLADMYCFNPCFSGSCSRM